MQDRTLEHRFWDKVRQQGECWQWLAYIHPGGYGRFRVGRRVVQAHRWAYECLVGPIPGGLEIDHLCRNRACVNQDHLEPVTHEENVRRGELYLVSGAKTHCPQRHEYTPENTYVRPNGKRQCLPCKRAQLLAWRARRHTEEA